jgi:hypothetical protein
MSDQYQSAFPDDGEGQLGEPAREDRRSDVGYLHGAASCTARAAVSISS